MDNRKYIERMKKRPARRAYIDSSEDESPPPQPKQKKPKFEISEEKMGTQFEA